MTEIPEKKTSSSPSPKPDSSKESTAEHESIEDKKRSERASTRAELDEARAELDADKALAAVEQATEASTELDTDSNPAKRKTWIDFIKSALSHPITTLKLLWSNFLKMIGFKKESTNTTPEESNGETGLETNEESEPKATAGTTDKKKPSSTADSDAPAPEDPEESEEDDEKEDTSPYKNFPIGRFNLASSPFEVEMSSGAKIQIPQGGNRIVINGKAFKVTTEHPWAGTVELQIQEVLTNASKGAKLTLGAYGQGESASFAPHQTLALMRFFEANAAKSSFSKTVTKADGTGQTLTFTRA